MVYIKLFDNKDTLNTGLPSAMEILFSLEIELKGTDGSSTVRMCSGTGTVC